MERKEPKECDAGRQENKLPPGDGLADVEYDHYSRGISEKVE
jgi:hypothetical protein